MNKLLKKNPVLVLLAMVSLIVPGFTGCFPSSHPKPHVPGSMVLVCDDWNVDNWFLYRDFLLHNQVKVTFYISHFHQMDSSRKAKLKILQADGHEIGYHTLTHPYIDSSYTPEKTHYYLRTEIDSGIQLMKKEGFNVQTFAFPGGQYTTAVADSLRKRFKVIRTCNNGFFEYWQKRKEYSMSVSDTLSNFSPYGIDRYSLFYDQNEWNIILDDLKAGVHVSLLFHSLGDFGDYSTDPGAFKNIISDMKAAGVPFKTTGEFFGY